MNYVLDFDNMSDDEKSLFMYAYYKVKQDLIYEEWNHMKGSRDRDNELYRWRYAGNEIGFHQTPLLKSKIEFLKKSFERCLKQSGNDADNIKKANKITQELDSLIWSYETGLSDVARVERERAELATFGLELRDLCLDFNGVKSIFETMEEDIKEKILSEYNSAGIFYNIIKLEILKKTPKGSTFGE